MLGSLFEPVLWREISRVLGHSSWPLEVVRGVVGLRRGSLPGISSFGARMSPLCGEIK